MILKMYVLPKIVLKLPEQCKKLKLENLSYHANKHIDNLFKNKYVSEFVL